MEYQMRYCDFLDGCNSIITIILKYTAFLLHTYIYFYTLVYLTS